ncbi:hypothetical protein [Actinoallomurus soli]|uniref:hypothetical protein n=1 Tax=Actinoallomurus soli TaxID=2952535 RepID=UPI002093F519|nr:hypothetical protein [Actinoallomurus soli]MCO5969910.1 hypothetical protein [Actinoallomurus soli]
MDVIVGLEVGAGDYPARPFAPAQDARVRVQLERGAPAAPTRSEFGIGGLVVGTGALRRFVAGRDVSLRARNFTCSVDRAART